MAPGLSILVVDDEPNIRKTLAIALEAEGHRVVAVSNLKDAMAEASRRFFDMALVDLRLGTESGMELIPPLRAYCPWMKIVVITAYASIDTAVEAMRRGAFDYLSKPFTPDQLLLLIRKITEVRTLEQRVAALQEALNEAAPEADLTSRSPVMQKTLALAQRVAESDATLLIRGESGTGKTMLARAIHAWSRRSAKNFGVVSCPSLSLELLESELFGHVKGAFTGALRDHLGRIAACEGGTLFLDEIGDLPLPLQAKLLRVLQEKEYERVGEVETRKADVRIIVATSVDLAEAVKVGRFREDLFYRLNVVEIIIPPLRQRQEDILPLAERFLAFSPAKTIALFSVSPQPPGTRCSITLGPATSGSCVMSSSVPSCFPREKPSEWKICRFIWRRCRLHPKWATLFPWRASKRIISAKYWRPRSRWKRRPGFWGWTPSPSGAGGKNMGFDPGISFCNLSAG
jgi:NtrC-family two-component system response regulator AlgB